MKSQEFAIARLKAIEKKYKDYFAEANLKIMDCVIIKGTGVHRLLLLGS